MTDPTPLDTAPSVAPPSAWLPGRDAYGYTPPFEAAEVAAQVAATSPRSIDRSGYSPADGDHKYPAEPFAPPAWVEVPADLAAALAEYETKRSAWEEAVDAVGDYQEDARASRAARQSAIQAAGRAAAQGKPRPKIPTAISESDEATETQVLTVVVNTRRAEADAAARKADRLTLTYAAGWAAEAVDRFGPALADATAAAQAAYESAQRAEAVLNQSAHWRSVALVADLKRAGVNVSEHQRARILSDLLDASKTVFHRQAEAQHRSAVDLLGQVHTALGTLRQCDPGVIPAPDTLYMPGSEATYRDLWRAMFDAATPERKRQFRERHTGGRLLRHEQDH
jgi:hypothetical protein